MTRKHVCNSYINFLTKTEVMVHSRSPVEFELQGELIEPPKTPKRSAVFLFHLATPTTGPPLSPKIVDVLLIILKHKMKQGELCRNSILRLSQSNC